MLKGKAKTDYQREYMRRRRESNKAGLTVRPAGVIHTTKMGFEPKPIYKVDAEGNRIYE